MNKVNRTANCKICGEISFRIIPTIGYVNLECSKCNNHIKQVYCGEYTTMYSKCDKCNSDEYKARIRVDGNGKEYWDIKCNSCGNTPTNVFIDDNGIIIDEKSREILIANNEIMELKNRLEEVEDELEEKSNEIDDYENQLYYKNIEIDELENKLYYSQKRCSELESKVDYLESKVRDSYY